MDSMLQDLTGFLKAMNVWLSVEAEFMVIFMAFTC